MSRVSRKPCPACGEVDPYRPAAEICRSCKSLIEDGKRFRKEGLAAGKDLVFCRVPTRLHFLEVKDDRETITDWQHQQRYRLEGAFAEIISLLTVERPHDRKMPERHWATDCPTPLVIRDMRLLEGDGNCSFRLCRPEVIEAVRALDDAIRASLVATAKSARAEGSSAIMALAGGDITLDEFNERAAGDDLRETGKRR